MKSLEVLCYLKDFEAKPDDKQKELLSALLETKAGKDILHEINLAKLIKQFTQCKKCPMIIALLTASRKAQNYFMTDEWTLSSGLPEVNRILDTWFDEQSDELYDVFISEDSSTIYMNSARSSEWTFTEIIVDGVRFVRDKKFDFRGWMKSVFFDSDRIYFIKSVKYNDSFEAKVWWEFYGPEDF